MHPPMVELELTYQKLQIPSSDIYEAMGYKDSMPVVYSIAMDVGKTVHKALLQKQHLLSSLTDCLTLKKQH